jgi:hypothetical protein
LIFLALVTFEHDGDEGAHLPLDCQGACGWMVAEAANARLVVGVFRRSLAADRLKLLEVDDVQAVTDAAQVERVDEHLAENMRNWAPGCSTVWGTLHCYTQEGDD